MFITLRISGWKSAQADTRLACPKQHEGGHITLVSLSSKPKSEGLKLFDRTCSPATPPSLSVSWRSSHPLGLTCRHPLWQVEAVALDCNTCRHNVSLPVFRRKRPISSSVATTARSALTARATCPARRFSRVSHAPHKGVPDSAWPARSTAMMATR